ncbi:MAG: hypothetical protein EOO88_01160 [Pedobacter sp.]|nr:MAG: hypothetical protein EOO88_01160 [Pedobacter sp.]
MFKPIGYLILSLLLSACNSGNKAPSVQLADLSFKSFFADSKSGNGDVYCLQGTGYFRAPRTSGADSLVVAWTASHLNAKVIPVSSFGPISTTGSNGRMIYCWLVDGADTINNYLVKQGACPGGTMMRPETNDEMSPATKEIYSKTDHSGVKVYIGQQEYKQFIEQIKNAEIYAREKKAGIWAKTSTEE